MAKSPLLKLDHKEAAANLVALQWYRDRAGLVLEALPGNPAGRLCTVIVHFKDAMGTKWKTRNGRTFTFDRMSMKVLGGYLQAFSLFGTLTPAELLKKMTAATGIPFAEEEFSITDNGDEGIHLQATAESWRWFGELTIKNTAKDFVPREASIIMPQRNDPTKSGFGVELFEMERGRRIGYNARVWFNPANIAFDQPRRWVLDTNAPEEYNAGNAMVIHNGIAHNPPPGLRLIRPREVRLALDPNLCTNLKGTLSIFYSTPKGY